MTFARRALILSVGVATGWSAASLFRPRDPASPRISTAFPLRSSPLPTWCGMGTIDEHESLAMGSSRDRTVPLDSGGAGLAVGVTSASSSHASRLVNAIARIVGTGVAGISGSLKVAEASTAAREVAPSALVLDQQGDSLSSHGGNAGNTGAPSAPVEVDQEEIFAAYRTAQHDLKKRFLTYAQRDTVKGEFVLTLDGFVRCMLLLPVEEGRSTKRGAPVTAGVDMDQAPPPPGLSSSAEVARQPSTSPLMPPSRWWKRLPCTVQQRLLRFFRWVDFDRTNSIGYAEFVVLFTFLSTPHQVLKRAFHVFDVDGNGRLSELEFCRLLNTIMVDPAVQVHYTSSHACSPEQEAARSSDGTGSSPRQENPVSFTKQKPASGVTPQSPPSATSLTDPLRCNNRDHKRHNDDLSFEISSALMRPLLFGTLPLHVGAPPGSMHQRLRDTSKDDPCIPQYYAAAQLTCDAAAPKAEATPVHSTESITSSSWWGRCGLTMRKALVNLPMLLSHAPPTTTLCKNDDDAALLRLRGLRALAQEEALLGMVSFSTFLYRMDYLRWELRAIEFGLCDPGNTGTISIEDCRHLLCGDGGATTSTQPEHLNRLPSPGAAVTSPSAQGSVKSTSVPGGASPMLRVSWQTYQKMFDIMKESDAILEALQLTLDAMPAVPEDMLQGSAIPDRQLSEVLHAMPTLDQPDAEPPASVPSLDLDSSTGQPAMNALHGTAQARDFKTTTAMTRTPSMQAATVAPTTAESGVVAAAETRVSHCDGQVLRIRPTALTWDQFSRVLRAMNITTHLTESEASLFRILFDEDNSNSLSPAEFARLCTLKKSFFAPPLPRSRGPRRNAVQRFFFCMQQLE